MDTTLSRAIRIVLFLGISNKAAAIEEISGGTGITTKDLSMILSCLVKARILQHDYNIPYRYILGKKRKTINITHIYSAVKHEMA